MVESKEKNNISKPESEKEKDGLIKVIGFGNTFMADDGIGICVIEKLRELGVFSGHDNVELIDGGTSGIDLIFTLQQADRALIIDAVDAGQEIGEIVEFSPEDIKESRKKKNGLKSYSLHDIDLTEVFELLKTLKVEIKIKIFGIRPKKVGYSNKLSPEVESKIPELISRIKKDILGG